MASHSLPAITSLLSLPVSSSILYIPSSLLTIKLPDENYILWKAQLVRYLKGHNLFSCVTSPPPPPADNPESHSSLLSWQQKAQCFMSLFVSAHVLLARDNLFGKYSGIYLATPLPAHYS